MSDFESKQISHFQAVTSSDDQTAKHYLEASKGDLTVALDQFYMDNPPVQSAPPTGPAKGTAAASGSSSSHAAAGNMKTLDMLKNGSHNESDDSDDDSEDQRMYAGGEKSGIAVKGPPKKKKEGDTGSDLVRGILEQAAKGAMEHQEQEGAGEPNFIKAFTGRGKRLGDPADAAAENQPLAPSSAGAESSPEEQKVTRTLTFWSDGFSVEDGPLLRYDDPANQSLLEQIKSGRAPTSLLNVKPDQPVEVKVAHRLQEEYKPPAKKAAPAFSGQGQRLGGITSSSIPGAFPTPAPAASSSATPPTQPSINIDSSLPITQIQVRLGDGTRMVARFNHTHTISDLRQFVQSARSEVRPFVIQTTMPSKILTEDTLNLKEAGLLNAVVVQRYV